MSAQDRFRAMLRDEIAPALRQRGFKGSGMRYVLPDDSHWLQLGFQSSRWSSSDRLEFTVNLSAIAKATWSQRAGSPGYGDQPNPNLRYAADMPTTRLGTLAFGRDHWWEVADRPANVAPAVLDAIDRVGLPWLRARGEAR